MKFWVTREDYGCVTQYLAWLDKPTFNLSKQVWEGGKKYYHLPLYFFQLVLAHNQVNLKHGQMVEVELLTTTGRIFDPLGDSARVKVVEVSK